MKQIYGKKLGMTRVFTEAGESVPVTVVQVEPNVVCQVKTKEKEGYSAVQVGFGAQKSQRVNRALTGHFAKAQKGVFKNLRELRLADGEETPALGTELKVEGLFENGATVDVTGITLGKGFAGVMKMHHMKGQPMTRGTHEYRRHGGSIGCRKFPGRVFKNKRMGGHMGVDQMTAQGITVVATHPEENLLLLKGSVPGVKNAVLYIREAIKG